MRRALAIAALLLALPVSAQWVQSQAAWQQSGVVTYTSGAGSGTAGCVAIWASATSLTCQLGITASGGVVTATGFAGPLTGTVTDATGAAQYSTNAAFGSSPTITWGSGAAYNSTRDTGLARNAQGIVKATDGSAGLGSLLASKIVATPLVAGTISSVVPTGTNNGVTYGYKVSACSGDGAACTAASAESTNASGPTTLGAGAYETVTWNAVSGATSYKLWRTTGNGALGETPPRLIYSGPLLTFADVGTVGSASTPQATNDTGRIASRALTSGRMPYVATIGTDGTLVDKATLAFDDTTDTVSTATVSARNFTATALSTPTITSVTPVLSKVGTITTVAFASLVDGDYFTLSDGASYVFEYDLAGDGVTGGRTAITLAGGEDADAVRDKTITAINGTAIQMTASSGGAATVALRMDTAGLPAGTNTENVADGGFAVTGMVDPTAATTYTYQVQAFLADGTRSAISATSTTAVGHATLSAQDYNTVVWGAVSGATSYQVERTVGGASQGIIATTTSVSVNDTGLVGAGNLMAGNTTGVMTAGDFSGPGTSLTGTAAGLSIGGNAATASDGVTSATGTAPLTLGLAAKALTGSIAITPTNDGGAVALQAATPGTQQTGNVNVSGTIVAGTGITGSLTGNASGTAANVTGVVTTAHGGLGLDNSGASGVPVLIAGTATVTTSPALGTPSATDLSFSGTTTTGLHLKALTTTQRDAVNPAAAAGDIIYNSTTQRVEAFDGALWHARVRLDGDTWTGPMVGNTLRLNARSTITISTCTNATPPICSATAHGLVTGDVIGISGITGLTNANGIRLVTRLTADTFSLQDLTGADITGNGAFGGTPVVTTGIVVAQRIVTADGTSANPALVVGSGGPGIYKSSSSIGFTGDLTASNGNWNIASTLFGYAGLSAGGSAGTPNARWTAPSAGVWQLGAADAAAPVSYTLQAQSVSAGTVNTPGQPLIISGSRGTDAAIGGPVSIRSAYPGAASGVHNTPSTRHYMPSGWTTLVESTPTAIATMTYGASSIIGAEFLVTVHAADASNNQGMTYRVWVNSTRDAAGNTQSTVSDNSATAPLASGSGTLTCTWSMTEGASAAVLNANCVSSLVQTTLRATWQATANGAGLTLSQP